MSKRNIRLIVRQNDLIKKEDQVIFNGIAQIKQTNDTEIFYDEAADVKVKLRINEKAGFLVRHGEALMQMKFHRDQLEECKVTTSVGDLFMDVKTNKIALDKEKILLYYELSEGDEVIGNFELRLEWEYEYH